MLDQAPSVLGGDVASLAGAVASLGGDEDSTMSVEPARSRTTTIDPAAMAMSAVADSSWVAPPYDEQHDCRRGPGGCRP